MQACDTVIMSNPHNPTGQVIPRADLNEIAARHPGSLLVADESYIDFLADPAPVTLIGCGLPNVIVLRSPSKFFGLAGARSGVAWSAHPLPASLRSDRTSWPVSAFAAPALTTALADTPGRPAPGNCWPTTPRGSPALSGCGLEITPGALHFRLLTGPGPRSPGSRPAYTRHRGAGPRRCLRGGRPAARITAPPARQRPRPTPCAACGKRRDRPAAGTLGRRNSREPANGEAAVHGHARPPAAALVAGHRLHLLRGHGA